MGRRRGQLGGRRARGDDEAQGRGSQGRPRRDADSSWVRLLHRGPRTEDRITGLIVSGVEQGAVPVVRGRGNLVPGREGGFFVGPISRQGDAPTWTPARRSLARSSSSPARLGCGLPVDKLTRMWVKTQVRGIEAPRPKWVSTSIAIEWGTVRLRPVFR